jgi:hypothetical protein
MQRLALSSIVSIAGLWREHEPKRIDHVRACLLSGPALTKDPNDLRNRCDDPAIVPRLVDNGQVKLLWHISPLGVAGGENGDGGKVLEISMAPDPEAPRGALWAEGRLGAWRPLSAATVVRQLWLKLPGSAT